RRGRFMRDMGWIMPTSMPPHPNISQTQKKILRFSARYAEIYPYRLGTQITHLRFQPPRPHSSQNLPPAVIRGILFWGTIPSRESPCSEKGLDYYSPTYVINWMVIAGKSQQKVSRSSKEQQIVSVVSERVS